MGRVGGPQVVEQAPDCASRSQSRLRRGPPVVEWRSVFDDFLHRAEGRVRMVDGVCIPPECSSEMNKIKSLPLDNDDFAPEVTARLSVKGSCGVQQSTVSKLCRPFTAH
eukprot:Selendium_serpulae@DN262_c0_g1_i1.p1